MDLCFNIVLVLCVIGVVFLCVNICSIIYDQIKLDEKLEELQESEDEELQESEDDEDD